jgi:uncharacterized protein
MLLIKTYLAPSKIHGIGLFAAADTPADTKICAIHPSVDRVYTKDELMGIRSEIAREQLQRYAGVSADGEQYVICGDDARFINHSTDPNCAFPPELKTLLFALRPIRKDEELTINYKFVDPSFNA